MMNSLDKCNRKRTNYMKEKVLLGLSGGVDSTAAALLLAEKGYEVTGYYFDVAGNNETGRQEAAEVANQLGIELIVEDVSSDFSEVVIGNFCREYTRGRTPNPCIICNPNIKFKRLIDHADRIGAKYIATGHYCKISKDPASGIFYVTQAENDEKDQSYMLYRLGQDVLSRLIFPLGEFSSKEETRTLARDNKLTNSEKKDSQEICFIEQESNYVNYIEGLGYESRPGDFIDKEGNPLGQHKGIVNYTLGQRKGLGIALGKPAFVTHIDFDKNTVTLGNNEDLFTDKVISKGNFFTGDNAADFKGKEIYAKVRYSAKCEKATFMLAGDKIITTFEKSQRAPTPGQSIVFYDGDRVIGGGFIE